MAAEIHFIHAGVTIMIPLALLRAELVCALALVVVCIVGAL